MAADLLFRIAAGEAGLHWETPPGVLRVRGLVGGRAPQYGLTLRQQVLTWSRKTTVRELRGPVRQCADNLQSVGHEVTEQ